MFKSCTLKCQKPNVWKLQSAKILTDVSFDFSTKLDHFQLFLPNSPAKSGFWHFAVQDLTTKIQMLVSCLKSGLVQISDVHWIWHEFWSDLSQIYVGTQTGLVFPGNLEHLCGADSDYFDLAFATNLIKIRITSLWQWRSDRESQIYVELCSNLIEIISFHPYLHHSHIPSFLGYPISSTDDLLFFHGIGTLPNVGCFCWETSSIC